MKTLFRWAFRLLILLVALLVAAVLLLDTVAREIAESRISQRTGLETKIGRVRIGLLNPRVTVENLVIYNSAEFGGSPLLDLPEVHVEYDFRGLLSRRLHCRLVRLNFASAQVVEDAKGRLNLEALPKPKQASGKSSTSTKTNEFAFAGIDTLNLTMGKIEFVSMKDPSRNETLKLGLHDQLVTNVTSAGSLDGIYLWILIHNGINVLPQKTPDPKDRWEYWRERLGEIGKRQAPPKSSP